MVLVALCIGGTVTRVVMRFTILSGLGSSVFSKHSNLGFVIVPVLALADIRIVVRPSAVARVVSKAITVTSTLVVVWSSGRDSLRAIRCGLRSAFQRLPWYLRILLLLRRLSVSIRVAQLSMYGDKFSVHLRA